MEFEELLQYARTYDKKAMMDIIEMYRPLLISQAIINEKFDEDLYQELVYTMLFMYFKISIYPYKMGIKRE